MSIGDPAKLTVHVTNKGACEAGPFSVSLSSGTQTFDVQVVSTLAAKASTAVSFDITSSACSQTWIAKADSTDAVEESEESNNTESVVIELLADLWIESVTSDQAFPGIGTPLKFHVTVRNDGCQEAGPFSVVVTRKSGAESKKATIQSVLPSASGVADVELALMTSPETFLITVDSDNDVQESNENNNSEDFSVNEVLTWQKPDLYVESITWLPILPVLGEQVGVMLTIRNRGDGNAGGFGIQLVNSRTRMEYWQDVPELRAGASTPVLFSVTMDSTLEPFEVRLDPDNGIAETNEDNNHADAAIIGIGPVSGRW